MLVEPGSLLQGPVGGSSTLPPISLVQPGAVDPRLVWERDQTPSGTKSTALGADGATWDEYGINVPRFHGVGRNVLLEGSRTNWINNPRAEEAKPGLVISTPLVAPGYLASAFITTRAHTPATASATRLQANGSWAEVAQHLPRFTGPQQRLLVEGTRTNLIRNPRGDGAGAGFPGTVPTFSAYTGMPAGMPFITMLASRSINGLPGPEVRFVGAASGSGNPEFLCESTALSFPLLPSTTYTLSMFNTLTGGSFANVTNFRLRVQTYLADGTTLVTDHLSSTMFPNSTQARYTFTFTTAATVATAKVSWVAATVAGALDYTIHSAAAQLELGAFASTPILPVVGTPAAATRAADTFAATLAALSLPASGACTVAMKSLRTSTVTGSAQVIAMFDDGTVTNRYHLSGVSGSTAHNANRSTAGANASSANFAGPAAGTPYNGGLRIDGLGNATGTSNGTSFQSVAGGPTTGLTNFRLGSTSTGTASYWGEIESLVVTPQVLDDTRFQSFVNAGYSSDGQIPSNWMMGDGISEVLGTGIENGINYIDLRLEGGAETSFLEFGWSNVTPGDPWSASQFVKLLSGSLTGVTLQTHMPFEDGGATTLLDSTVDFVPGTGALGSQRYLNQNAVAPATSELVRHRIQWVATENYSFVLRVGWPQLEEGLYISSPTLPAVGTPAAATRGVESASATLTSLGIASNGASNIRFTHRVGIQPQTGVAVQTLFQIDDGTANNRANNRLSAETLLSRGINFVGGVSVTAVTGQPPNTAGFAPFEMNIRGDGTTEFVTDNHLGTNRVAMTIAGAPLVGLTTFRIARPAEGGSPFWGEVQEISIVPRPDLPMILVKPGILNPAFTTTRAHTPATASATRQLADGTWAEVAQNLPRFTGAQQRLLVEGARTNSIRNPRAEGTPGVTPTNWTNNLRPGLAMTYGVPVVVNGLPCIPITFIGTTSDTTASYISFDTSAVIPAAEGGVWTGSFFIGLDPSYTNITAPITNFECRVTPAGATETSGFSNPISTTMTRFIHTKTMAAGTTGVTLRVRFATSPTPGFVDFRMLIAAAQLELGAFASTPILPPVGAPAAATRNPDDFTATPTALGLPASGASTVACKSLRSAITVNQFIFVLDDGTGANRFLLQGVSNSTNHVVSRRLASAQVNTSPIAGPAAGVLYNSGMRVDGLGNASGFITGQTMQSVAGGPTTGLTVFRIGNNTAIGTASYWGEIESMVVTPAVLSDAAFQSMVDRLA